MKKLIILGAFLFSINSLNAQTSTNYEEASNPISTNPSLWVKVQTSDTKKKNLLRLPD